MRQNQQNFASLSVVLGFVQSISLHIMKRVNTQFCIRLSNPIPVRCAVSFPLFLLFGVVSPRPLKRASNVKQKRKNGGGERLTSKMEWPPKREEEEEEEGRRDWTREIKEKVLGRTFFSLDLRECVWLPTLPVCNLNLQPPFECRRKVGKASIQIFFSSWLGQLGEDGFGSHPPFVLAPCIYANSRSAVRSGLPKKIAFSSFSRAFFRRLRLPKSLFSFF